MYSIFCLQEVFFFTKNAEQNQFKNTYWLNTYIDKWSVYQAPNVLKIKGINTGQAL